jgi:hypothetical protein
MWSGPRNISTALMRSWSSRADTFVCDEPLYAHYLLATGVGHPGAGEVIARHETDWRKVVRWLTGPVPEGKAVFYQKHMSHHLLPGIDRGWLDRVTHCFLIRNPQEVISSLVKFIPEPRLEDTGLAQQVEIFRRVRRRTGATPLVLDAQDVLEDPRALLDLLCRNVGLAFDEAMLSWAPGPRESDGVWARHWYAEVEQSSGFAPYSPKSEPVPDRLRELYDRCLELYKELYAHRLS